MNALENKYCFEIPDDLVILLSTKIKIFKKKLIFSGSEIKI